MDFQPIVKWIGSKRIQSEQIIQSFPNFIDTFYEPFCGGCSVMFQLLNSKDHFVNRCVCSDINGDLIDMWNTVKRDPDGLFGEYTRMWCELNSIEDRQDKRKYFEIVREEFNQTRSPYCFFFIMRTCTNGVPRYNKYGNFNNSFHLTRDGITPTRLKGVLYQWSELLNDRYVSFIRGDYRKFLPEVTEDDFIYFDPPYEITRSTGKYFGNIDYLDFYDRLRLLNDKGIKYALSFEPNDSDLIVPGDCYENVVNIVSKNGGYRKTFLKLDNNGVFENLYLN